MDIEKKRQFLTDFAFYGIWIILGYAVIRYALPLLSPFVIGFIIAYGLRRPVRAVHRKTGINKKILGLAAVVAFYLVIGTAIFYTGFGIIRAAGSVVSELPQFFYDKIVPVLESIFDFADDQITKIDPTLHAYMNDVFNDFIKSMGSSVKDLSVSAIGALSGIAANVPGMVLKILFTIISSVFITIDYDRFAGFILAQFRGKGRELVIQVKSYVVDTLFVCVKSYATIMFITFIELSIGLTLIGIDNSVIIAACIAVFDVLPVLGTGGIMIPWTVISAVQGNYRLAVSLLVVYVVVTVIRNIIEPKIVGGNLGLHPVVTLACIFSGAMLFGAVGLFGFPIGLSLLKHLNDTGVIHLYNPHYGGTPETAEQE